MPTARLRVLLVLCSFFAVSLVCLRPALGERTERVATASAGIALVWPPSHGARVAGAAAFLTVGFFWLFRVRARLGLWASLHLGLILALTAGLMIGWGASSVPDQPKPRTHVQRQTIADSGKLPPKHIEPVSGANPPLAP